MLDEMRQQPAVIRGYGAAQWRDVKNVARAASDARFVVVAARGTSDHAAAYAKYLIEILCGLPVALAAPSVTTLYRRPLKLEGALVIGISQSGEAPDVAAVLSSGRESGAVTVAVTNVPKSPLGEVADHVLSIGAGTERAVAATKTYTATLATLYMLASAIAGGPSPSGELASVADAIEQALGASAEIERVAERFRFMDECVVLGRGFNYATAMETALKIIETSYVLAKSYSAADFMHGPIALLREGFPCLVFGNKGPALAAMLTQATQLVERKAELLVVSDSDDMLSVARCPIRVPFELKDELAPMAYVVYGQLFAYYLARTRGHDPDRPRALHKVTRTV